MNNSYILGNNLLVKSPLIVDPALLIYLEEALVLVQQRLQAFASEADFTRNMAVAFGEEAEVDSLEAAWLAGDLSIFPELEIRNTAELNGAKGAYSSDTNRIYLSWEFLQSNQGNTESLANLLLEEIGHRVDSLVNSEDSAGDEGEIFSALVRGETLSSEELQRLRAEDDRETINLDGQIIQIEKNTSTWINPAGGDWREPDNWSLGRPAAFDDVLITQSGDYTVNLDVVAEVNDFTLGGSSGTQTFSIGRKFTLNGTGTVNSNGVIDLNSSQITGSGTLTTDGVFNWIRGMQSGSGTTVINNTLNLIESTRKDLAARTLETNGTTLWTGTGPLYLQNGATWTNRGIVDLQSDADLDHLSGAESSFNNQGTLIKSVGSDDDASRIDAIFNNTATVEVQQGHLKLERGGTSSGSFQVTSGATLEFGGSFSRTYNLTSEASLTGAGTKRFSGGTSNVEIIGDMAGTTEVTGGTVNFNSSTNHENVVITGGTANFNGSTNLENLVLTGRSLSRLSGTGTVTATDATWSGGTQEGSGTTVITDTLNITGTETKYLKDRTLETNGTTLWTGTGELRLSFDTTTWTNRGTVDLQSDADWTSNIIYQANFNNQGTLIKSVGSNEDASRIGAAFNNTGTVEVQQGHLKLERGGTSSGSFQVAPTAILEFGRGTHNLTSEASITGVGTKRFSGGTSNVEIIGDITGTTEVTGGRVNFNGSTNHENLVITEGNLSGTGTVTATDATWSGGAQSGSGTTVITDTLNITGDSRRDLNDRNLETNGTTLWTGTGRLNLSNAASWTNRGIVDLQSDADWGDFFGTANFNNQGTLIKSVGSNEDASEIGTVFINTGTVEVQQGNLSLRRDYTQTAGVTRLNGGAIATTRLLDIQGGELAGFGTITGDVTNAGQLNPGTSTGILNITGDYTQTATGVLNIEVGGIETGSGFDQLNITGTADLEGRLNLSQVNQFAPQLGQQFQILTFDEADSGFTNIDGLELSNGLFFNPTATEEGLALKVVDELTNLGALRGGSTETVTDSVGNTDSFDYYRFNLTRTYNIEFKLSGLTANADIKLLDSLGRTIAEGINPGTTDESFLSSLDTGIYFLQVSQAGVGDNTNYQLELVTDGVLEEIVNTPPTLETLIADQNATEDAEFNLDISGNFDDVDAGDSLTYSATGLPDSLTINSETGVISGTVTNSEVGTTEITVTATDTEGESISDTFDLTVENVNDAPTLLTEVSDQNATENTEFNLDISGNFNDVDAGDSLTYSATSLPDSLTINSETGAISGTPSNSGIGTTEITVTATDIAGESVSDTFDLTVAGNPEPEMPDNREPEIADNAMVGTANSDTIFGTASDDIIYGLGGNDHIFASEGNNVIFGGTGNDRIYGGSQSDIIEGEAGDDIIFAGDGNNIVFGGTGNDIIYTGYDSDLINGGFGNDVINLGGGQDIILLAEGEGMDTIINFQVWQTSIGLSGGLTYNDLTITQIDGATLISAGDELLATLSQVEAIDINAGNFVTM